jgi:hypothetical protein
MTLPPYDQKKLLELEELQGLKAYASQLNQMIHEKDRTNAALSRTLLHIVKQLDKARKERDLAKAETWGLLGMLRQPWKATWAILKKRSTRAEFIADRQYRQARKSDIKREARPSDQRPASDERAWEGGERSSERAWGSLDPINPRADYGHDPYATQADAEADVYRP